MDLPAFVAEVKAMRAAQRAYFRARTPGALEESKRRERLVDSIVAEYGAPPGLFPRDDAEAAHAEG